MYRMLWIRFMQEKSMPQCSEKFQVSQIRLATPKWEDEIILISALYVNNSNLLVNRLICNWHMHWGYKYINIPSGRSRLGETFELKTFPILREYHGKD